MDSYQHELDSFCDPVLIAAPMKPGSVLEHLLDRGNLLKNID